jgi:3-isopropylmalate/(R)-2-methylmalate dehydratase small subunit
MMKTFGGKVLFLDRSDINTDEIIPAKYLTEVSKEALAPYLLEDLKLEGFVQKRDVINRGVVVTRANFGCGSSREHAPWALEVNGIHVTIAEGYARIFRQNMYNCGMLAIELAPDTIASLFEKFSGRETDCRVSITPPSLTFVSGSQTLEVPYQLEGFDKALVESGGWVEYADEKY